MQTAGFDFVNYDDSGFIYQNPHVATGLSPANVRWAFTIHGPSQYHPLTWLSFMLDAQVFGLGPGAPGAFHAVNFILHGINAVLVCLLLWTLTASVWRSAIVAAIFAVHPLRVESVAWIAERKDVLSAALGLACLLAYVNYARRGGAARYILTTALLALGLAAKPMLVTWPAVMLLLDLGPLRRHSLGVTRLLTEKLPWLALASLSTLLTILVQRSTGTLSSLEHFPLPTRLANAVIAIGWYLSKLFVPINLAVFYPYPRQVNIVALLASAAVIIAISVQAWRWRRQQPWLLFGWLFMLITLAPVIGIVQSGEQAWADRYTYLPLIGVVVSMVWGVEALVRARGWNVRITAALTAMVIVALTATSFVQTTHWRDSESLMTHALAVTERNFVAHTNLAALFTDRGQHDEAITHARAAIAASPRHPPAYLNLGSALQAQGKLEDAAAAYREAVALRPNAALGHFNLGSALHAMGRVNEAIACYERALALDPAMPSAHTNLGFALFDRGQLDAAIAHYRQALEVEPSSPVARTNLGMALSSQGQHDAALREYEAVLRTNPGYIQARFNMAVDLQKLGRHEQALRELQVVITQRPDIARAYRVAAESFAALGQHKDAKPLFEEALRRDPNDQVARAGLERLKTEK